MSTHYKTTPAQSALKPFARQWQINALAYILQARRDGTTAVSPDCLFQNVRIPASTLEGAPLGANARYFAREIFNNDVIGTSHSLRAFASLPNL